MISKLHYITQENVPNTGTEELVKKVLKGGADWIQLRMKSGSDAEKLTLAKKVKTLRKKSPGNNLFF